MIQITGGQLSTSGGTLTGPLAIAVGSAAAPGLAVAGDANTGLWAPAAATLAVSTAGVERLRVASSGFFGVGTTNPGYKLDVAGTANILTNNPLTLNGASASLLGRSGGANDGRMELKGYTGFQFFTFTNSAYEAKMTLNISGYVGIGEISPTAALHVPASSTARASLRIPAGTAPTIPNAGDVWVAGTVIKFFDGTTTKEIAFV